MEIIRHGSNTDFENHWQRLKESGYSQDTVTTRESVAKERGKNLERWGYHTLALMTPRTAWQSVRQASSYYLFKKLRRRGER